MPQPTFVIVAGPNGSGKTTFAYKIFKKEIDAHLFVNADEIARKIDFQNIDSSEREIGRKALAIRNRLIESKESFVLETTLATLTLANTIRKAQAFGYKVILNFLWIPDPWLCDFRVKERVSKGGHNIPTEVLLRRHMRGLQYLNDYIKLVDEANIYLAESTPTLIAQKNKNGLCILLQENWNFLQDNIKFISKKLI